jgi:hypothetical protein
MGQRIQRRRRQSYKVLWIISLFSAIHTTDTRRSVVMCDFLRIILCLFKALTGFHGCSCPHPVLSSIRRKGLQWEVRRSWRLRLILNYTIRILSVCLYPYLTSMQSERVLLYCHLCPARIYHIFSHYLKKGHDFRKNNIERKMCFDFPYKFSLKHFFASKKNSASYYIYIYIYIYTSKVP